MHKRFTAILLAVFFTFLGCSRTGEVDSSGEFKLTLPFGRNYNYSDILVKKVIDGDTLYLENGQRVRLIGIDTPEVHDSPKLRSDSKKMKKNIETIRKLGEKSYDFTKNLVEGKRVRLEFDVERFDKYERLLAYVYLQDGTFVNAKIVQEGYASLMTIPPNVKYAELFLKLYQEARDNNKGLWKE